MRAASLAHQFSAAPPVGPIASRRSEGLSSVLLIILAIALLGVCQACSPFALQRWFVPLAFQTPVDVLSLLLVTFAAMLLHETGHLVASLILGFKVLGGSLGPLQLQTLHGTWKLSFSRRSFFTGSVSAVPQTPKHWRVATMIVVGAGPLATLASMFLVAGLKPHAHLSTFAQLDFVQVSAILFIIGLIPTAPGSKTHNDARLFLDLALQNQGSQELELNVLLGQQVLAGVRPEDYPEALVARLAAWRGRPESELFFAQALVRWALDSGNVPLADSWDLRALALAEQCNGRLRNTALASSACLDVIFREDSKSACTKFDKVDFATLFPKCFELRARAAHQLAIGHTDGVSPFIIRAQYAIPPGISAYTLERTMLEKLHLKVLQVPATGDAVKQTSACA